MLTEGEVSAILKAAKPLEVELNKNDSINSLLTIRKWGFKAMLDTLGKATLTDASQLGEAVKLAYTLSEFDFHLVERAVDRAGISVCEKVLKRVSDILSAASKDMDVLVNNRDALFTVDGIRRTPGGVFWRFLKEEIPKEDSKYIFKNNTKRQQSLRRKLVRDRWTENHLTILGNKRQKTASETADKIRAVKDIAASLSMSEVSIIERLVVKRGIDYARSVLAEVNAALNRGADERDPLVMVTEPDAPARRRTPGGVFAHIVKSKSDLSESDKRFIFARATGGRAPSMSDLMSMSLALLDRAVKPPRSKPATAAQDDPSAAWEYQRKVGNTWEPGFVGQENLAAPIPELTSEDQVDEVIAQIAAGLKMFNFDLIEKLVATAGIKVAVAAYRETAEIERNGGMVLSETNPRKRTPQGVYTAVLRRMVGDRIVDSLITSHDKGPSVLAPQLVVGSETKLADRIIVELERMRIPESDFDIVRSVVSIKGESFVRNLFEKVRRRFNKGKWQDTPGQLFGKMLKIGLSNEELNLVFESSRARQLVQNNKRAIAKRPSVDLLPSEEKCVEETTVGLALIGVTASEVSTVERIVARLGQETALRMLARTREIEREGGQRTRDEQRRKTPSGVFLSLLSTEEKVSKDDLKFVLDKPIASSAEERKKEDSHFAPSLFTPVNPFRVIDNSGKDSEFIERIKKQIRPALGKLEFISVLDPRLETVIRGVVLLGPSAINLIDQCVYVFGEKRTEGWLEVSHAQVADSKAPVEQLPSIYNDLVKAAGGLPPVETTAGIRS